MLFFMQKIYEREGEVVSVDWWVLACAFGIPTLTSGSLAAFIKGGLDKDRTIREGRQRDQDKMQILLIEGNRASLKLGKATAEAVRDGHCNGNVTNALAYAKTVDDEHIKFLTEQGVQNLHDHD